MQINQRLRIEPNVITRITQTLKGQGKFNVSVGQEVTPEEIIGVSESSIGFRMVNLSSMLGVPPKDVKKYLQKGVGQRIYKGELLAFKKGGLLSPHKTIVAPTDGILEEINEVNGNVRMRLLPHRIELPAAVFGIVENIDPIKGQVIIKTQVTRIYGVFGSGRQRGGILHIIGSSGDIVGRDKITLYEADKVLMCGSFIQMDALKAAVEVGASGIITGGIGAREYKSIAGGKLNFSESNPTDVGISFVVSEGFGTIPIGQDIYDLLKVFNDKFVMLDGNNASISLPSFDSSCMIRIRKTSLPPLVAALVQPVSEVEVVNLELGQKVRIVGNPYMGLQGVVVGVNKTSTLLPSGISTYLVTIETHSKKVQIPFTNIERI